MKRKALIFLIFLLLSLDLEIPYAQSTKKRPRTDSEINLFCRNVDPQNLYCSRWIEIKQKRLEIESVIHSEIRTFCHENPLHSHCKKTSKISIFTFCTQIAPDNQNCLLWKNVKQAELEVKGILSEEIQKFCQKNPQNNLCREKVK